MDSTPGRAPHAVANYAPGSRRSILACTLDTAESRIARSRALTNVGSPISVDRPTMGGIRADAEGESPGSRLVDGPFLFQTSVVRMRGGKVDDTLLLRTWFHDWSVARSCSQPRETFTHSYSGLCRGAHGLGVLHVSWPRLRALDIPLIAVF